MKKMYLIIAIFSMLFLVSCGGKSDDVISYSADDIYLKCIDYGNIISGFPEGLLIFESEGQLKYALYEYECMDSLSELSAIREEYPIGEYVYIIQYFEREYDAKMVCKGLNIDTVENTIHFEHKNKNYQKDGCAAIKAYITYAVLPKEYLEGYDFSNQPGVLYLGK